MRKFEEFLEKGIVIKRFPDIRRSKSLKQEAKSRKLFLDNMIKKLGITDENANYFIENAYDLLLELIRSILLTRGFSTSSHEAEVSYMRNLNFTEHDVRFMNDLRYFRNGILYYGKRFDADYAKKVIGFVERSYPILSIQKEDNLS
jgi:hypothetical protein